MPKILSEYPFRSFVLANEVLAAIEKQTQELQHTGVMDAHPVRAVLHKAMDEVPQAFSLVAVSLISSEDRAFSRLENRAIPPEERESSAVQGNSLHYQNIVFRCAWGLDTEYQPAYIKEQRNNHAHNKLFITDILPIISSGGRQKMQKAFAHDNAVDAKSDTQYFLEENMDAIFEHSPATLLNMQHVISQKLALGRPIHISVNDSSRPSLIVKDPETFLTDYQTLMEGVYDRAAVREGISALPPAQNGINIASQYYPDSRGKKKEMD